MKYETDQSSMNSLSFIVIHYYFEGDVVVAHYTTANALFNAKIKLLQFHCIFFENSLFKLMKMKGDGFCLYRAVASHIMSCCLDDVWTERFPPIKKPGIKLATVEVVNDLKN